MGPMELAALCALAQQESWRVNALPAGVGIDTLRVLDADKLIEARAWVCQNLTRRLGDPTVMKPQPWSLGWVSPASSRDLLGSWDDIHRHGAEQPETAGEVRVTERGRAELVRLKEASMRDHTASAPASAAPTDGRTLRRDVDRFIRERLRSPELRAAAERLDHAVSDEAWWATEVAEYRGHMRRAQSQHRPVQWWRTPGRPARVPSIGASSGWSPGMMGIRERLAALKSERPRRSVITNPETTRVRPYWHFAGHAALSVFQSDADHPPPRGLAEAWDIVLAFWLMTTEDAPLRNLGLGAIADWELPRALRHMFGGRKTFWRDVMDGLGTRTGPAAEAEALIHNRTREALVLLRDREATPVATDNGRPVPVEELIGRLSTVLTLSRWLREHWVKAKRRARKLPIPEDLEWQEVEWGCGFPCVLPADWKAQRLARSEQIKEIADNRHRVWAQRLETIMWTVLQWRAALDAGREAVPAVEDWTDDKRQPAINRWTAGLLGELARLGGVIHRLTNGNVPITRNREGPRTIKRVVAALSVRLAELKRIPPSAAHQYAEASVTASPVAGIGEPPPTYAVAQFIDKLIGMLERAEVLRVGAQARAERAVNDGDIEQLRTDPASVLGSPQELNHLKLQFDTGARPFVQVAYALKIDAAPLDDFIRTGGPVLVPGAIAVLRQVQAEDLRRRLRVASQVAQPGVPSAISPPQPAPHTDPTETTTIEPKPRLPPEAFRRAAESFEWVCRVRPDLVPATPGKRYAVEQWRYVREHATECPAYTDAEGRAIPVPNFETWKRQVRGGQFDPTEPKALPRAGRAHGGCIVRPDQV